MKTWIDPRVEVRASEIEGKGLFANASISAGEQLTFIADDNSVVMTDKEFEAFIKRVDSYDAVALGGGKHRVSTVSRDEDPSNYGNHSCDPNAERNERGLVAKRDISANEEITSDYGPLSRKEWSMECHCGSANCRKVVKGEL